MTASSGAAAAPGAGDGLAEGTGAVGVGLAEGAGAAGPAEGVPGAGDGLAEGTGAGLAEGTGAAGVGLAEGTGAAGSASGAGNRKGTRILAATGSPPRVAGAKRHWRTAAIAAASNSGPALAATPFFSDYGVNSRLREGGNLLFAETLQSSAASPVRNAGARWWLLPGVLGLDLVPTRADGGNAVGLGFGWYGIFGR